MLNKLMKYEFRATSRLFFPMYLVLVALAVVNRLVVFNESVPDFILQFDGSIRDVLEMLYGTIVVIASTSYFLFMFAVFVISFVIMLMRFYKNQLGDEGYLMFTLPVEPWKHIASKAIVSTVWNIVSGVVVVLSLMILFMNGEVMSGFASEMQELIHAFNDEFGLNGYAVALEFIVVMLVSCVGGSLCMYLCMSIGQTAQKHKILASFGAYLGLSMVSQMITSSIMIIFMNETFADGLQQFFMNIGPAATIHVVMLCMLIYTLVFSAAYFFGTNYMLSKKLNLE